MKSLFFVGGIFAFLLTGCGSETDVAGDYYAVDIEAHTGSSVNGPVEAGNASHDDSVHDNPIDNSSHEDNDTTTE